METQSIEFIDTGYKEQLLGLLRDKVFHVTTAKAFESIRKDGFIYGNQALNILLTKGLSKALAVVRDGFAFLI